MTESITELILAPLADIWARFMNTAPNIIVSILFLLVGLTLARFASSMLNKMLRKAKFDDKTARVGVNEILERAGFGKSPSNVAGFLVYWTILLIFIITAANTLQLNALTALLERFMDFIPDVVISILILLGGLLFANLVRKIIARSSAANNLGGGKFLSQVMYFVIVLFTSLLALEQIGIQMFIINSAVIIVLSSMGLAFAIAFGLGAKDSAAEIIKSFLKKSDEH